MKLYAIDDRRRTMGVIECNEEKARKLNEDDWGIFYTPNSFKGARKAENIDRINYWFIDIDDCNKDKIYQNLLKAPAIPSKIIETRKGFHAYWKATDATVENFENIERRLIYKFGADKAAKDLPRLLRMPTYYHCKQEKYLVSVIFECEYKYNENEMMFAFKAEPEIKYKPVIVDDFNNIDPEILLKPYQIRDGERNDKIFKKGVFLKKLGASEQQTAELLMWLNSNISSPISETELDTIIRRYSQWNT